MNKYIIDTNVLIDFNDSLPMDVYITQWKMIICEAVFNEIKKSVELKQWLEKYKKLIESCYSDKVLIEAKVIINNYPKLIEINNPSDQSDPYIIAQNILCFPYLPNAFFPKSWNCLSSGRV